ncbi:hypothetical protein L227DRAFT_568539 [Lentinus tigrinus ALCF2SS1-6]|uniref:Uncharacterized protein n=1 Tax=Lentinus tigrinus ALCF2SS1-6 TaxID=1328759 RepID=A0A5C2RNL9_9APHY|nr:hypothetical protein L227DRAFT_568539 [Lentinus tigrinus ALCF2SS1-6]
MRNGPTGRGSPRLGLKLSERVGFALGHASSVGSDSSDVGIVGYAYRKLTSSQLGLLTAVGDVLRTRSESHVDGADGSMRRGVQLLGCYCEVHEESDTSTPAALLKTANKSQLRASPTLAQTADEKRLADPSSSVDGAARHRQQQDFARTETLQNKYWSSAEQTLRPYSPTAWGPLYIEAWDTSPSKQSTTYVKRKNHKLYTIVQRLEIPSDRPSAPVPVGWRKDRLGKLQLMYAPVPCEHATSLGPSTS